MKGKVINFEVLRIQSELENYNRTRTLPHTILDGAYNLDDIFTAYYHKLTPRHRAFADHLKRNYHATLTVSIASLRSALRKDYAAIMGNLATEHHSFIFSQVMNKYRPYMNPVRALYYEVREVKKRFSSTNDYHVWLVTTLTDKLFRSIILDAIGKDVAQLEKIIQRYYMPIVNNSESIPLELFHAKQTISDFRHYYTIFEQLDENQLEE